MINQETLIYCDECKYEFSMNSVEIKEAIMNLGGQALTLVYFTCPKCNKIYRIMLKDKRYEELREDLERIKMRIRKNRGSGNIGLGGTLASMLNKKQERLKNYVSMLNNKFPGTFTFVVSENNHEDKITYLP